MEAEAVLGDTSEDLAALIYRIPNAEHPSDHLPVGALFRMDDSEVTFPAVEFPETVDDAVCEEWFEIVQFAGLQKGKQARKQQRKLEDAFLATCSPDDNSE